MSYADSKTLGRLLLYRRFNMEQKNDKKYSTLNFYPFDVLWPKYGILRAKIPF